MPVCSNCGGNDFVWAENLKTGTIGRGTLSLRSGGELAIGTRVCRGCGHADLFVKDPTILRQPHTWKPGEFVPITPRPASGPRPADPAPVMPVPTPTSPAPPSAPAPAPEVGPPAAPALSGAPDSGAGVGSGTSASPTTEAGEAGPKKPARRKNAKSKPPSTAILQS